MLDETASGVFVIAPTPFHEDGSLDEASLDRLVDAYIEMGVAGITVLGVMGEAPKLEHAEALHVMRSVIVRAKDLPVIIGVSAPGFATMRSLAASAMEFGAAGVMVPPSPGLRTDDQILGYYRTAVAAIGEETPFVVQDYPFAFNVTMTVELIAKLAAAHSSMVMLKQEDWPGLDKITALRRMQASRDMRRFSILCGNGGLFLDLELERGVDGAMTGYAFPDMLVELVDASARGEREHARTLFNAHLPLIRYEHQPVIGLAARKYVMMKRGLIASDAQRAPAARLSGEAKEDLHRLLARLAREDPRAAGIT